MPDDRSSTFLKTFRRAATLALVALPTFGGATLHAQVQGYPGNETTQNGSLNRLFAPPGGMPVDSNGGANEYGVAPVESVPLTQTPAVVVDAPPTQALPPNLPPTQPSGEAAGSAVPSTPIELSEEDVFAPAEVLARVGRETILAGDLLGMVNQQIDAVEKEVPKEQLATFRKTQLPKYRRMLMARLTQMSIEMKLLYFDFLRLVPPERQVDLKNEVGRSFMEKEAPRMMETFEVSTVEDLDAKLRSFGSSLAKARQLYIETSLGKILLRQKINDDPKISHQNLLDRYQSKKESYHRPARVRYEELVVKKAKHPGPAEAFAELAAMGNEVLGGAPLSAVAKRRSHGFGAAEGGQQSWINRGSLVTLKVEEVLFDLPIGKLSRIIEESDAFYIVRVLERDGERYVPFEDVQEDLREEIEDELLEEARKDYLVGLYEKTHVWNKFERETAPSLNERERQIASEGIESMIPSLAGPPKAPATATAPQSDSSSPSENPGVPVPARSSEFELR